MRRPKFIAQPLEFNFVANNFNLASQGEIDGARVQAEIDTQAKDRAASAAMQTEIPMSPRPARDSFRVTVHERARLSAGDVVRLMEGECKVLRVTDCAAVVELPAPPPREGLTRFGKRYSIAGRPSIARISANSECEIVSRAKS